jgi:hypothetical protein
MDTEWDDQGVDCNQQSHGVRCFYNLFIMMLALVAKLSECFHYHSTACHYHMCVCQQISAAKLKKWSAQLQQAHNTSDAGLSLDFSLNKQDKRYGHSKESHFYRPDMVSKLYNPDEQSQLYGVDKKLTYKPVPGTGGQTKLTFI